MKKLFFILLAAFATMSFTKNEPAKEEYTVTFFLSPTCKICQFYTLGMKELYADYSGKGFYFHGLMPGKLVEDADVDFFRKKYKIPFDLSRDTNAQHMAMNATVTPEVFVTDKKGIVIYHGRIDDSYASVGKRRTIVKNHELRDVLDAIVTGNKSPFEYVPAVGCLIEKP